MKYNVAILGASGSVGLEIIKILEQRKFPINQLFLLASPKSVGKEILFQGTTHKIQLANEDIFHQCDIIFGAVNHELALHYAPMILKSKALFIDNSSAFRNQLNIPLVIPEINAQDIQKHHRIIANPNCSTIITLCAIYPIHQLSSIQKMIISTYQAVSGAGNQAIEELYEQNYQTLQNQEITPVIFPYPIAYNLISTIGEIKENGYTSEELKMQKESRRILHEPQLFINCTCIRVPIIRCHSISITLQTKDPLSYDEVSKAIQEKDYCLYYENKKNHISPMPLYASNQDLIHVGRLRKDISDECGFTLWCCGDQLRKGAALNAVQIAEAWIQLKHPQ